MDLLNIGLGMSMDSTYILIAIGAIISMIASWNVKNTFNKYSSVGNSSGTGCTALTPSVF